jgi:hypothetical protein
MFPNFGLFSQVQNMRNITEFSANGKVNRKLQFRPR